MGVLLSWNHVTVESSRPLIIPEEGLAQSWTGQGRKAAGCSRDSLLAFSSSNGSMLFE